jgi:hypothetical protein
MGKPKHEPKQWEDAYAPEQREAWEKLLALPEIERKTQRIHGGGIPLASGMLRDE